MAATSTIIEITGDMAMKNIANIRETIISKLADDRAIAIDLKEVGRVDLSGLQMLCGLQAWATKHNQALSILNLDTKMATDWENIGFGCLVTMTTVENTGGVCS